MATAAIPSWQMEPPSAPPDWSLIKEQNLEDYVDGRRPISELQRLVDLVLLYEFRQDDKHFTQPAYTVPLARMLQVLLHKSEFDANVNYSLHSAATDQLRLLAQNATDAERRIAGEEEEKQKYAELVMNLENSLESVQKEKTRLSKQLKALAKEKSEVEQVAETQRGEIKALNKERSILERQLEDLRRLSDAKDMVAAQAEGQSVQIRNEHQDIVARFSDTRKQLERLKMDYARLDADHASLSAGSERRINELSMLVRELQQDNAELARGKLDAEEACAACELRARDDAINAKKWHEEDLEGERERFSAMEAQLTAAVEEAQKALVAERRRDEASVAAEVDALKRELEQWRSGARGGGRTKEDPVAIGGAGGTGSMGVGTGIDASVLNSLIEGKQQLMLQVDEQNAEIQRQEIRILAQDEENARLANLLYNYESKDVGLKNLNRELAETKKMLELRSEECQQLRERLAAMEDVSAHNKALRELCKRLGVTEEELRQLDARNASTELDTLRQEIVLLKDEIIWLEKERKHWMHKVRLQPLLDTKLRYEIGLTEEQRRTVESIVDQMKAGAVVVEEDGADFKEKYFALKKQSEEQIKSLQQQMAAGAAFVDGGGMLAANERLAAEVQEVRRMLEGGVALRGDQQPTAPAVSPELLRELSEKQAALIDSQNKRIAVLQSEIEEKLNEVLRAREDTVMVPQKSLHSLDTSGARGMASPRQGRVVSQRSAQAVDDYVRSQVHAIEAERDAAQHQCQTIREQMRSMEVALANAQRDTAATNEALQQRSEDIKGQEEALQTMSEKLRELEKINEDLNDQISRTQVGGTKELLSKIVLLRQRETKLLQRLRMMKAEQTRLEREADRRDSFIASTLQQLLDADSDKQLVRASSLRTLRMEHEMLGTLRAAAADVLAGKMFRVDQQLAQALVNAQGSSASIQELATVRQENVTLQLQVAQLKLRIDEMELQGGESSLNKGAESDSEAGWRQRCALYSAQLASRDEMIRQLEEQHRSEVQRLQDALDAVAGAGTGEPVDVKSTGEATADSEEKSTGLLQLESEAARLRSMNVALLQSAVGFQAERKVLMLRTANAERRAELLESTDNTTARGTSELVSATLAENLRLQEQVELLSKELKTLRLRTFAVESNFRVAMNEASSYKIGAYRLYRHFVDHIVAAVELIRRQQRSMHSAVTVRQAQAMTERLATYHDLLEQCREHASSQAGMVASLQRQLSSVQDVAGVEQEEDSTAMLHGRLRSLERRVAEQDTELRFTREQRERQEQFIEELIRELGSLEAAGATATGMVFSDALVEKLEELRVSVHAKSESPPVALTISNFATSDASDDTAVAGEEYKGLFEKFSQQSKEISRLSQELAVQRKSNAATEALRLAAVEERNTAEARSQELLRALDSERAKFKDREEKNAVAAQEQFSLAQRAAEHNLRCLKELLSSKEATIAQLHRQLADDRERYLESQVVDSLRLERLHEQLFRESNVMLDRFRSTINAGETGIYGELGHTAIASQHPNDMLMNQVQTLTNDLLAARRDCGDLRSRNALLEAQLSDQIAASRRELHQLLEKASPSTHEAILAAESTLLGMNRDQAAALEAARQQQQTLRQQLEVAEREIARLAASLREKEDEAVHPSSGSASAQPPERPPCDECVRLLTELTAVRQQLATVHFAQDPHSQHREVQQHVSDATQQWRERCSELELRLNEAGALAADARRLKADNEMLRGRLAQGEEEQKRLISATGALKQRLVEMARDADRKSTQATAETAIAHRVSSVQEETAAQIRFMRGRLEALELDVASRAAREQDLVAKLQSSRTTALEQHELLAAKDQQIAELRREIGGAARIPPLTQGHTPSSVSLRRVHASCQTVERWQPTLAAQVEAIPVSVTDAAVQCTDGMPRVVKRSGPGASLSTEGEASKLRRSLAGEVSKLAAQLKKDHEAAEISLRAKLTAAEGEVAQLRGELAKSALEKDAMQRKHAQKVQELRERFDANDTAHKKAVLELLEAQRRSDVTWKDVSQSRASSPPPSRTQPAVISTGQQTDAVTVVDVKGSVEVALSTTTPRPGTKETKETATRSWLELQTASSHLGLHETIRKQARRIAQLEGAAKELPAKEATLAAQAAELDQRKGEILALKSQLAAAAAGASETPASPADIRTHKKVVFELEDKIDALNRRLSVEKEEEIRQLKRRADTLETENTQLERELRRYKGITTDAPLAPTANCGAEQRLGRAAATDSVDRVVELEGQLLDLRFERETLAIKLARTERHMRDIMAADEAFLLRQRQQGHSAPMNGGAIPGKGGGALQASHRSAREVAALEGVVENMKSVIARLKHENEQLRTSTISASRHVELQRELKVLRSREKELLDKLKNVMMKLQQVQQQQHISTPREEGSGSGPHGSITAMHRQLRLAQDTIVYLRQELQQYAQRKNPAVAPPSAIDTSPSTAVPLSAPVPLAPECHAQHSHHHQHHDAVA